MASLQEPNATVLRPCCIRAAAASTGGVGIAPKPAIRRQRSERQPTLQLLFVALVQDPSS
jgi:hypothetical protein